MHTKSLHKICLNLALALALPFLLSAQQSGEAKPNPNQEAHIGNATGHAHAGAQLYYRYCWGCHGARGNGMAKTRCGSTLSLATSSPPCSSAAPLRAAPCRPTTI